MFTGIIEATASVLDSMNGSLTVERPEGFNDIKIGSSISVAGVCLSVVNLNNTSMTFDVVEETLKKTRLGELQTGDTVNLERSMKASDRFDGHIVQGHVEDIGIVEQVGEVLSIDLPSALLPSVIAKGSIAIDGVSLTVASIEQNLCTIALIPHTVENTTLGNLKPKMKVNIETDILARYSRSS